MDTNHLLTIFKGKVFPLYNYCGLLFSDANISKLQIVQNKLLKIITNSPRLFPTNLLHRRAYVLTIKDNFVMRQVLLIHDILNKREGETLYKNCLELNRVIHKYATRSAELIHLNHTSFSPCASVIEKASLSYNKYMQKLNLKHIKRQDIKTKFFEIMMHAWSWLPRVMWNTLCVHLSISLSVFI